LGRFDSATILGVDARGGHRLAAFPGYRISIRRSGLIWRQAFEEAL